MSAQLQLGKLCTSLVLLGLAGGAWAQVSYTDVFSMSNTYESVAASGTHAVARGAASIDFFTLGPAGWSRTGSTTGNAGGSPNDVAMSGDVLVFGAQEPGRALYFENQGGSWVGQQSLNSPDSSTTTTFGAGVAVAGDTMFLGDPALAKVYIFQRTGNGNGGVVSFVSAIAEAGATHFGYPLATDGRWLLVGSDAGVYAYPIAGASVGSGQHLQTTLPSNPSLSIAGPTALVTGTGDTPVSIYTFDGATWALDQAVDAGNARYAQLASPTRFLATSFPNQNIGVYDRDPGNGWGNTGAVTPPVCANDDCSLGTTMTFGAGYLVATAPGVAGPTNVPYVYIFNDDFAADTATALEADFEPSQDTPTALTAIVYGYALTGSVEYRDGLGLEIIGCAAVPVTDNGDGTGTATCTLTLPTGTSQFTAEYLGDGANHVSTSSAVCVSVGPSDRLFADNFEGGACGP